MSRYTDAEIAAKIDAVLDDTSQTDRHALPWHETVDQTIDAESVDSPIGANDGWQDIAAKAWETLSGETELPEWFDDLTTIGELARRTGKERDEVRAALDDARPVWLVAHPVCHRTLSESLDPYWRRLIDEIDGIRRVDFGPSMSEIMDSATEAFSVLADGLAPLDGIQMHTTEEHANRAERRGQRERPAHVSPYTIGFRGGRRP